MTRPSLSFTALGGIGEIGMNCYLFTVGGDSFIVDMGLALPDGNAAGIGVILPDLSGFGDAADRLRAILFTHGHDDHIGGYPYYRDELDVPVIAPPFAVELLKRKLHELRRMPLRDVTLLRGPRPRCRIGALDLAFFRTDHSIPQSYGFGFETPWGPCLFTSDFKRIHDPDRLPRRPFLLFCDATNAELDEDTAKRDMHRTLDRIFRETGGAIVATTFSSHIERIKKIIDLSKKYGRTVFAVGRNLVIALDIAKELRLIKDFKNGDWDKLKRTSRSETVIITTGTQGERYSALNLIAHGNYRGFTLREGDAVVLSSSIIPGNERNALSMVNRLAGQGAAVYYSKTGAVHTSGHGSRKELLALLRRLKPRYVVPIHGEQRHLTAFRDLAAEAGIAADRVLLLGGGAVLDVRDGRPVVTTGTGVSKVFLDAGGHAPLDRPTIKARKRLHEEGVVAVTVRPLRRPEVRIVSAAVVSESQVQRLEEDLSAHLRRDLPAGRCKIDDDTAVLRERVKQLAAAFIRAEYRKKPVILVTIQEE